MIYSNFFRWFFFLLVKVITFVNSPLNSYHTHTSLHNIGSPAWGSNHMPISASFYKIRCLLIHSPLVFISSSTFQSAWSKCQQQQFETAHNWKINTFCSEINSRNVCWGSQYLIILSKRILQVQATLQKKHEDKVCYKLNDCTDKTCQERHPKLCRSFSKYKTCRHDMTCAYLHREDPNPQSRMK